MKLVFYVNHLRLFMSVYKFSSINTWFRLKRLLSNYLYLHLAYVLKCMCLVIDLAVILYRLLSILQILYYSSAFELCFENVLEFSFSHFRSFVVSPKYHSSRHISNFMLRGTSVHCSSARSQSMNFIFVVTRIFFSLPLPLRKKVTVHL